LTTAAPKQLCPVAEKIRENYNSALLQFFKKEEQEQMITNMKELIPSKKEKITC
jgi:hypothetical protein